MDTEAVTLFLALLALVCQVGVAIAVVLWLGGRFSATVRSWGRVAVDAVGPQALALGAAIAFVAMLGSLYLSEVADFPPCRLCWYQRYAMYPLGPLLAVAAWRPHVGLRIPAAVLATVGAGIAVYHVLLERYPSLGSGVCEVDNPCTLVWVERFGYLTIPGMALSGFLAILVLLAIAPRRS